MSNKDSYPLSTRVSGEMYRLTLIALDETGLSPSQYLRMALAHYLARRFTDQRPEDLYATQRSRKARKRRKKELKQLSKQNLAPASTPATDFDAESIVDEMFG